MTYSECVSVALFSPHAKLMRRTLLSSVACPTVLIFSTLSHKNHNFRKTLLNIKYVFCCLYNFCRKYLLF